MNKKNISVTLIAGVAICTTSTNLFAQDQNAPVNPVVIVDQFEATSGKFEGYRRSGAKGICAIGEFRGSAVAREISTASAFSGNPIKVVVRFSVGGANVGNGSIIAAGTVIPPRFVAPDYSIIAGNPAQVIGQVRQAS